MWGKTIGQTPQGYIPGIQEMVEGHLFTSNDDTGSKKLFTVTLKTVPMIGHPEEIDQPHHGKMLQN